MFVAVCMITLKSVLLLALTSLRMWLAVISTWAYMSLLAFATSMSILSSSTSIAAHAATISPSVRTTRWWMPMPSTITLETRLQSSAAPGPATASATIPTWVVVSRNQA